MGRYDNLKKTEDDSDKEDDEDDVTWKRSCDIFGHVHGRCDQTGHVQDFQDLAILGQYGLTQTLSTIVIDLKCVGVHLHPEELIQVHFYPLFLEVKIKDLGGQNCAFFVSLAQGINVEESKFELQKDVLKLTLQKSEAALWHSYFSPPSVLEEVKGKFAAIVDTTSEKGSSKNIFRDISADGEWLCNYGPYFLERIKKSESVALAHIRTVDQLIGFVASNVKNGNAEAAVYVYLAAALLYKERRFYIKTNQELLKKPDLTPSSNNISEQTKKKAEAQKKYEKGNQHFKANQFHESVKEFTEAVHLDPDCSIYYLSRSVAYFKLSNYSDSLKDANTVLNVDPFNGKAWLYLSKNYFEVGDIRAIFYARHAKYLEPFDEEIDSYLVTLNQFDQMFEKFLYATKSNVSPLIEHHFQLCNNLLLLRNTCRDIVENCCANYKFHIAKNTAKSLLFNHQNDGLLQESFYCLGVCAYYEDDEDAMHLYFKKCFNFEDEHPLARNNYEFIKRVYLCRKKGIEYCSAGRFDKSIKWYLIALKLEVVPLVCSKILFQLATVKLKQEKRSDAIFFLSSAIEKNTNFHVALSKRGECHLADGKNSEAKRDFGKAYNINPCQKYRDQIKTSLKTKQVKVQMPSPSKKEGEGNLKKAVPKNELAECSWETGNDCFEFKKYKDAIRAYSKAIGIDSKNHIYYADRCSSYIMLNDFKNALKDAKSCLKIAPSFGKALLQCGTCCIALGQPREAIVVLQKAAQLNTEDEHSKAELSRAESLQESVEKGNYLMGNQDFMNAEHHFSAAVSLGKASEEFHLKYATCLLRLDKFSEAFSVAKSTLALNAQNWVTYYYMGLCSYYQEDQTEALKYFQKSLSIDKTQTNVTHAMNRMKFIYDLKHVGNQAFYGNNFNGALQLYQEGLKVDPKNKALNAKFRFNIGMAYAKKNDWDAAIRSFTCAISLNKSYLKSLLKRAESYLALNNIGKALKDYEEANKVSPCPEHQKLIDDTKIKEKALTHFSQHKGFEFALADCKKTEGDVYFQDNKYENALRCYSDAIFLNPDCAEYYTKRSNCYISLNSYLKALAEANESLNRDPISVQGFIQLGVCHNALGNTDESIAAFKEAEESDPENKEVAKGISTCMKLKKSLQEGSDLLEKSDLKKAVAQLTVASKIACCNSSVLLKTSECLAHLQRLKDLSALIKDIPTEIEDSADVLFIKALHLYYTDQKEDALTYLDKVLDVDSSNTKATKLIKRINLIYEYKEKGEAALHEEDTENALRYFEMGLKVEPDNAVLLAKFKFNIGLIKMKHSFTDAIDLFCEAIKFNPDYRLALKFRGQCYQKVDEHEKAVVDYQKLYDLTSSDANFNLLRDAHIQVHKQRLFEIPRFERL